VSLFQASTTTLDDAKSQIADAAGESSSANMLVRAGRSFAAAIKHWNNLNPWDALRVEMPGIPVIGPFTVSGCAFVSGSPTVTTTVASGFSAAGVVALDLITGSGARLDLQVATTGVTALTANLGASATVSGVTLTFVRDLYDLPSDFKSIYTARLLAQNRTLKYVGRRVYDRTFPDQSSTNSPWAYDLFRSGDVGKIRLVFPPAQADTLKIRYYRRMSGTATPIDVLDDWEPYLLAWAKWHYLTDKGEGRKPQADMWLQFAQEGIKQMISHKVAAPDEDLAFEPASTALARQAANVVTDYWE